jgi:thiol-disulfide isomerase/thioredoxin
MRLRAIGLLICLNFTTLAFAQSGVVRLEGQVVCCPDCWAEAVGTRVEFGTAEDLLKAQSCIANGDPTLIAVREGDKFKFYQLEQGKFRLQGKSWLEFVGQRVAVMGNVKQKKSESLIYVDSLEKLAPSLAEQEASKVIGTAPELNLNDPFGNEQRLSALKGRVVVLNFWATYCVPCRKEMPDLAAIQNEYGALGVQVVGASTDEPGDRNNVLRFVKETRINFPIWIGATTADMMRFGLGVALPGTVVIGRDGRIGKVISGPVKADVLRKQIDAVLASTGMTAAEQQNQQSKQVASTSQKSRDVSSVPS